MGSRADLISIVAADAELAEQLDETEREHARREALTRVRSLSIGEWDAASAVQPDIHHRGFLVIDGLLSREVEVLDRRCIELIGPGDVLRPWSWDEEGAHVHAEVGWTVLEPTQLAVDLDRQRGLGQPGADRGGGVRAGRAVMERENVSVGKLKLHCFGMLSAAAGVPRSNVAIAASERGDGLSCPAHALVTYGF